MFKTETLNKNDGTSFKNKSDRFVRVEVFILINTINGIYLTIVPLHTFANVLRTLFLYKSFYNR